MFLFDAFKDSLVPIDLANPIVRHIFTKMLLILKFDWQYGLAISSP